MVLLFVSIVVKHIFLQISDETILALVSKHSYISLGERAINVQPETLIEATKVGQQ